MATGTRCRARPPHRGRRGGPLIPGSGVGGHLARALLRPLLLAGMGGCPCLGEPACALRWPRWALLLVSRRCALRGRAALLCPSAPHAPPPHPTPLPCFAPLHRQPLFRPGASSSNAPPPARAAGWADGGGGEQVAPAPWPCLLRSRRPRPLLGCSLRALAVGERSCARRGGVAAARAGRRPSPPSIWGVELLHELRSASAATQEEEEWRGEGDGMRRREVGPHMSGAQLA